MPNLLLISDCQCFKEDLQKQLELYAPEFTSDYTLGTPDVVILDDKLGTMQDVTKKFPHTPIFALVNSKDEKPHGATGVRFITKPLILSDFINAIKASINLAAASDAGRLRFNNFELRPLSKEIFNIEYQESIRLTEKEIAVIQYLYKNSDRIVTRDELLRMVWGYNPEVTTHTVETHIYRLRQKIEHNGSDAPFIASEDGGYCLVK